MARGEEFYIGDGVYVSFDGFGYKLRTQRSGVDHWIYLEDRELEAFDQYRARIEQRSRERGHG